MSEKYTVSNMNLADLKLVESWIKLEGWNPGICDARIFFYLYPKCFFMGYLDSKPIACGSAVIYDNDYAFCGYYYVLPEYRHKGFGMLLTKHRLAHIGKRNAGIDGVMPMVEKYKNIGYKIAHQNVRYVGCGPIPLNYAMPVVTLDKVHLIDLNAYDRKHFPASRPEFIAAWIRQVHGCQFAP